MDGFVYRWTNQINGRWYLGSHAGTPDDGYVGSGKAFRLAVEKYRLENFLREILYLGEDFKGVEDTTLKALGLDDRHLSYNIKQSASGGVKGILKSAAMKLRLSETRKKKFQEQGFLNSFSTRQKMSQTHEGVSLLISTRRSMSKAQRRIGNHPPAGSHTVPHTEESKRLISKRIKEIYNAKRAAASAS